MQSLIRRFISKIAYGKIGKFDIGQIPSSVEGTPIKLVEAPNVNIRSDNPSGHLSGIPQCAIDKATMNESLAVHFNNGISESLIVYVHHAVFTPSN
jgi:hypothetical protein